MLEKTLGKVRFQLLQITAKIYLGQMIPYYRESLNSFDLFLRKTHGYNVMHVPLRVNLRKYAKKFKNAFEPQSFNASQLTYTN